MNQTISFLGFIAVNYILLDLLVFNAIFKIFKKDKIFIKKYGIIIAFTTLLIAIIITILKFKFYPYKWNVFTLNI